MSWIERRIEAKRDEPDYQNWAFNEAERARGKHRSAVGGKWDEMGQLQQDFLVGQGLTPSMNFLDVGCGSLRAGRHLVHYLEPAHYYGIDIGADVVEAGYDLELDDEGRARLPQANLRMTDRFDADFGVSFDMAIAQSVFTHVSLNQARLCLFRLGKVMRPGATFYATFREQDPAVPVDAIRGRGYSERNVYWHYRDDLRWIAERTPFEFRYIGDWNHPANLMMAEYTRLPD